MSIVVAIAGLAGSGKTTAATFLEQEGFGRRCYAGQAVLDEVERRQLPAGAESEKAIRLELRKEFGPFAIARLSAPRIRKVLDKDLNVLLDAIFSVEELSFYKAECSMKVMLLVVDASFALRSRRLSLRTERSLTEKELRCRDEFEEHDLRIEHLFSQAQARIRNDASLEQFYGHLLEYGQAIDRMIS